MTKTEELDQLNKAIKDAETSQKSIQTNIDQITKEISQLTQQKTELEENLEFHKRAGIIPIAHEYGKTKKELTKVVNRLGILAEDHKKTIHGLNSIQEILVKLKRDYVKVLNSNENNVVHGLFGANRGKK